MSHLIVRIFAGLVLFCCSQHVVEAQALPDFCESVEPALLNGLAAPYGRHVAPGGMVYCEGLLPKAIAIHPPEVISVKQSQSTAISFDASRSARVTWQSSSLAKESAHLKLRAMKSPLFALDASVAATHFEWNPDLIARLQPEWRNIAALVTHQIEVMGQQLEVVIPVRQGLGCSESIAFLVRSSSPIHLTTALFEPVGGKNPYAISISSEPGPAPNTWQTTIPLSGKPKGVFLVTLSESIHLSGAVSKPVYLLVGGCGK